MINYFGYGANSTPEMMEAIIGRAPQGKPAVLSGYELCIQVWSEVPESAKVRLSKGWGPDFQTYCIRPKDKSNVTGTLWQITDDERWMVSQWEYWYEKISVEVEADDKKLLAETEMVNDPAIKRVVHETNYNPFCVPKEEIIAHAVSLKERLKGIKRTQ
jgi:hypothetical protein